ncbi:MAG: hypothetical protein AAF404_04230, partial [Pseudomonadota bacterium]
MSIRVQLILFIVIAQVAAHVVTFAIIMGWLVGGEQESRLEVDAADVFIGVLSTLTPQESSAQSAGIVRIVEADNRFSLSPS